VDAYTSHAVHDMRAQQDGVLLDLYMKRTRYIRILVDGAPLRAELKASPGCCVKLFVYGVESNRDIVDTDFTCIDV
jgi:hypothetical protein